MINTRIHNVVLFFIILRLPHNNNNTMIHLSQLIISITLSVSTPKIESEGGGGEGEGITPKNVTFTGRMSI